MSWYRKMLKIAHPYSPVICPHDECGKKISVDVKQIDTSKGQGGNGFGLPSKAIPGQKVETGECFARCPYCRGFLSVAWANYGHGYVACHGNATVASEEEVRDAVRNGAIITPCQPDDGNWEDMKYVADIDLQTGKNTKPNTVYEKPLSRKLRNVGLDTVNKETNPPLKINPIPEMAEAV